MGMISIDNLKPGMVLAADVTDRGGRTLLASGQEIAEKHMRIFKMWGVLEVNVQGEEQEQLIAAAAPAIDPERLRQVEEHMQELFALANTGNSFMKELLRLATLHAASQREGEHGHSH